MKKFSSLLVVLLLMLASFTAGVEYQRGDVDQDGQVGIADVTCLIDYLLNGTWSDNPVTPPDSHEYVDLGLPSGTLWATCNVGANSPEEYGDYFAWGETAPKENYTWTTYKWCNGTWSSLTKYCTDSNYGIVDNKTELAPEDDAAYVNWGASWRMPTVVQAQELCNNCTWRWITLNCTNGRLVTGPNGNTMFLPAGGEWGGNVNNYINSYGYYWTHGLYGAGPWFANYFGFDNGGWYKGEVDRYWGHNVRAVRVSQN